MGGLFDFHFKLLYDKKIWPWWFEVKNGETGSRVFHREREIEREMVDFADLYPEKMCHWFNLNHRGSNCYFKEFDMSYS